MRKSILAVSAAASVFAITAAAAGAAPSFTDSSIVEKVSTTGDSTVQVTGCGDQFTILYDFNLSGEVTSVTAANQETSPATICTSADPGGSTAVWNIDGTDSDAGTYNNGTDTWTFTYTTPKALTVNGTASDAALTFTPIP